MGPDDRHRGISGHPRRVAGGVIAGLPVSDYQRALMWYERLLGSEPAFFPNATEAVWELAEH